MARTGVRKACAPGMNSAAPHSSWMARKTSTQPQRSRSTAAAGPVHARGSYASASDASSGAGMHLGELIEQFFVLADHARERILACAAEPVGGERGTAGRIPQ